MADETGTFKVNGIAYHFPENLTMGEMCDAERFFGVEFGAAGTTSSMRMAAALMWVAVKRVDPTVTVEDIRDLPSDVFESFMAGDASPPESENDAASEPSGDPSENGGEHLDENRIVTGPPGLDIGSDSGLVTSPT